MDVVDEKNNTALVLACASKKTNLEIIKILIAAGSELDFSGSHTPLTAACSVGDLSLVNYLIEQGANVNTVDQSNQSPLYHACNEAQIHFDIIHSLISAGANLHQTTDDNQTCLHTASEKGNVEVVNLLIQQGIDVHVLDKTGRSALHYACCVNGNQSLKIIEYLVNAGADPNQKDNANKTPLMFAYKHSNFAAVHYLIPITKDLDTYDEEGYSILHKACILRQESIVRLLLEYGADVNLVALNEGGSTPLMEACFLHKTERNANIVDLLIDAGADINIENEVNSDTALIFACRGRGNVDMKIVHRLVEAGANLNHVNREGVTALGVARSCKVSACVAYLSSNPQPVHMSHNRPAFVRKAYNEATKECAAQVASRSVRMLITTGKNIPSQERKEIFNIIIDQLGSSDFFASLVGDDYEKTNSRNKLAEEIKKELDLLFSSGFELSEVKQSIKYAIAQWKALQAPRPSAYLPQEGPTTTTQATDSQCNLSDTASIISGAAQIAGTVFSVL
ncbi:hypothetical protein DB42_AZ00280 [Neochlamydia sp. EPS4]|uniref:ankyrin repeat domain-containing protein n=1 Tax=Neochlamydia sp. EPS4 TaxID=1478175 RepID=UPI000583C6B7|nr:ankyrin repeat domain-containing protein [Neochlamydia sp. EPS4]KIC74673.1 hypothetical protein DB42_AZ00280 [Neochlamydia sp. EPS4]